MYIYILLLLLLTPYARAAGGRAGGGGGGVRSCGWLAWVDNTRDRASYGTQRARSVSLLLTSPTAVLS